MCGIIGIASNKSVTSNIIQSLKKLEYRGYDSAGIATITRGEIDEKNAQEELIILKKYYLKILQLESWVLVMLDGQLTEYQVMLMHIHIHRKKFR